MSSSEWLETSSGNRIHKTCTIKHPEFIVISGNSTLNENCKLIVDNLKKQTESISIGKYTYLSKNVVIETIVNKDLKEKTYSINIGSYTTIGKNSKIYSMNVGSRCKIGSNCRLGAYSIIYDCCIIHDNVIIPDRYIIPPLSEVRLKTYLKSENEMNFYIVCLNEAYRISNEGESKRMYILGETA
ncbi:unnamed protein product [[Candida] boidinii]|uniref:Dynactin subunit 5 n=1 Tax=Candida boidinii TaxID=5477 RepID=A0A9W6SVK2_CANBO|nr:unnamed protein product [[Candida] boidinii]GMF69702.1 unnamed protein product [[Candida] boidinii]GMG36943.1 unnamed protein product [[Candida] boidinii]